MKQVAVIFAAVLVIAAGGRVAAQRTIIQKIIVKVNGEIFTQTELETQQIQKLKDMNRTVTNPQDLSDKALMAVLAPITPGILVDAVDELLLVQHAKELGVKFTEDRFKEAVETIKKNNPEIKDDAMFQSALKEAGMTMAQLRVNVERAFMIQTVQNREILKNMTLTEEEAHQYYNAHKSEFVSPATVSVREIFVNVATTMVNGKPAVSVGADDDAKDKITALRERALKGEDFAKLVEEASDSATKATGGLIGPVLLTDLNPSLAEMLEKLKPGEITEPVRQKTGYQILRMETRSGAEPEPFEKSRDAISQKILESRMGVEQRKFISKLLTQAVIEWKDESYQKMNEVERAARLKNGL
jgi:parvulin-like peptidyl-prolyl isomerase